MQQKCNTVIKSDNRNSEKFLIQLFVPVRLVFVTGLSNCYYSSSTYSLEDSNICCKVFFRSNSVIMLQPELTPNAQGA